MSPGALDAKTKDMIYVAVSIAHGCNYCIHSHTAAARAKGMSEAEYAELVAVVGMASETNRIVTALGVEIEGFQGLKVDLVLAWRLARMSSERAFRLDRSEQRAC
jgi:AhpD family alkylhydroperoxidase